MVSPVRFDSAVERLYRNSARRAAKKIDLSHRQYVKISDLVEIGPHCALQGPIRDIGMSVTLPKFQVSYNSALARGKAADTTLLELIGNLHCRGFDINLQLVNGPFEASGRLSKTFTTLPEYPYDHSQPYWSEPRIAKNIRLPLYPHHELLGLPAADWNPLEPRWRNNLKKSSISWLEDHQINNEILYPAAAMIVMAIEGITQVSDGRTITAYELKDVHFHTALPIPTDDSGVEVQFHLKLIQDPSERSSSWATFALFAYKEKFMEICRGSIKATFSVQNRPECGEEKQQVDYKRNLIRSVTSSDNTEIDSVDFYTTLRKNGYQYGPTFQGVRQSLWNNSNEEGVAKVPLQNPTIDHSNKSFAAVHPCVLDEILQLAAFGGIRKNGNKTTTWLPTYLTRMWISSSYFNEMANEDTLQVYTTGRPISSRFRSSNICAMDEGKTRRLIEAENIETTLVIDNTRVHESTGQSQVRRLCYDLIYKPDFDLADPAILSRYMQGCTHSEAWVDKLFRSLTSFIFISIAKAVNGVNTSSDFTAERNFQKQHTRMISQIPSTMQPPLLDFPPDWIDYTNDSLSNGLRDYIKSCSSIGKIFLDFSDHLVRLFLGTADSSEKFDQGSIIEEYHRLLAEDSRFHGPLRRYIDTVAHKSPAIKILQTGAGNISITESIIDSLAVQTSEGTLYRFSHYDITDSSESRAKSALEGLGTLPKAQARSFNVEQDPVYQGYEENSYDLVIAVNLPHNVDSAQLSLKHLRKLLRNGGKLLTVDFVHPISIIKHLTFPYVPELWQAEEVRQQYVSCEGEALWSQELELSGISGVDLTSHASDFEGNSFTKVFVSSNVETSRESRKLELTKGKPIFIISGFDKPLQSPPTHLIASKLRAIGIMDVRESCFGEVSTLVDSTPYLVIVVPRHQWLSLEDLDDKEYSVFHATINRYKNILWISEINPSSDEVPSIGAVQGLARTLRMENNDHIFATVGIDTSYTTTLEANLESALRNFLGGVESKSYEPELVQIGELLHIPRVYECDSLNKRVSELSSEPIQRLQRFGERNLQLKVQQSGLLDTLHFEEVREPKQLADDEIEVEVKAIGVNFKDCLVALGRVPDDSMGCECAGVVTSAGSKSGFQRGDCVFICAGDTFRSRLRCLGMLAMKIPNGMTFSDASALSTNFITAYHSLVVVAKLTQGESILIHSGAGGTGQAAIQIAKMCGAQVFTTVSSPKKKELIHTLYDIPMENIFNSRDLSFADGIRRLTRNTGVDVVLNSLAGDALIASWECVASFGRFVEIGKKDILSHNKLPMFQFARNVSFSTVDIAAMVREKPRLIQDSLVAISDLFNKGALRLPSPIKSFPISQVEAAVRYLQTGANSGKVVVEVDPNDNVLAAVTHISGWAFNQDETFVIAGGLGGQGRSISKWMVSKGARNLVLLSRTGPRDDNSVLFIRSLEKKGVTVHTPKCDISDAASLGAVLDYCKLHMPPIKGCIQAAMDIRDSIFENMSHEAWTASLKPKIRGSWNLHQLLPRDLDFFIMFSSISGIIGSQGQSNYAVGNTFQDELAKYRLSRGEKAISLDLGILSGDGYLAENQDFLVRFARIKQMLPINEAEVLALLEHFCDKSLPLDPTRSQLVLGLDLPKNIISRGLEPSNWTYEPMFANLQQMTTATPISTDADAVIDNGSKLAEKVAASESLSEAADILANGLAMKLGTIFSMSQESFDLNQPLHNYGVDSLIAVELRNWFIKTLKVDLAVFEILGGATAMMLGQAAAEKMRSWT